MSWKRVASTTQRRTSAGRCSASESSPVLDELLDQTGGDFPRVLVGEMSVPSCRLKRPMPQELRDLG